MVFSLLFVENNQQQGEGDFVRLTKGSGVNRETPSSVGSRYFLCSRVVRKGAEVLHVIFLFSFVSFSRQGIGYKLLFTQSE